MSKKKLKYGAVYGLGDDEIVFEYDDAERDNFFDTIDDFMATHLKDYPCKDIFGNHDNNTMTFRFENPVETLEEFDVLMQLIDDLT